MNLAYRGGVPARINPPHDYVHGALPGLLKVRSQLIEVPRSDVVLQCGEFGIGSQTAIGNA